MSKNVKLGLSYLFPIIAPLIILFAVKDNDDDDKRQIGQALVLDLALIIVGTILGIFSTIPFIGIPFAIINALLSLIPLILGILYLVGQSFRIPVIYDLGSSLVSHIN